MVGITWYAVQAYCLWLSLFESNQPSYRLPTEMEWEWAAGGKQETTAEKVRNYPWSDEKGEQGSTLANYGKTIGATTPVGNYPDGATPEGLYDMAGNVWEWMESLYKINASDRYFKSARALRGGSWCDNPVNLRCSARFYYHFHPANWYFNFGFRVIRSSPFSS